MISWIYTLNVSFSVQNELRIEVYPSIKVEHYTVPDEFATYWIIIILIIIKIIIIIVIVIIIIIYTDDCDTSQCIKSMKLVLVNPSGTKGFGTHTKGDQNGPTQYL